MNQIYWIILFIVFPPAALLLGGVKIAEKLLKVILCGYLITVLLLFVYVLITV